jgi:hypothetical protein
MRLTYPCAVLLSVCTAVPAFCQNTVLVAASPTTATANAPSTPAATAPAAAPVGPIDLSGFKEIVEQKNKTLSNQVNTEKAVVKKNGQIIQDAKKIAAANKKLEEERKQLAAQNAALDQQRQAMQAEERATDAPSTVGR